MSLQTIAAAFFSGFVVGAVFKLLKLPVPAPGTWEGVMSIFGIFIGYLALKSLGS